MLSTALKGGSSTTPDSCSWPTTRSLRGTRSAAMCLKSACITAFRRSRWHRCGDREDCSTRWTFLRISRLSTSRDREREIVRRSSGTCAHSIEDTSFIRILARPSRDLAAGDFGQGLSFCHIDGGHSRQETFADLRLCHEALATGGLLALDDYFNVEYPGVSEGAVEFMLKHPGALQPLAIGFNKVLFQKQPVAFDTNEGFLRSFRIWNI